MTTTYTLTGTKIAGHIELQYTDGYLNTIKLAFKEPLNEDKFRVLFDTIAQQESGIVQLAKLGFTITKELAQNEKLGLFCHFYEKHKGLKYKVSAADSGKIKLIKVSEPILTSYFTSPNFIFKDKHSVSNLVRYYNELLAEMVAATKSKHPDYWSDKHAASLDAVGYKSYIGHLHQLGYKPTRDRNGNVKEWVKN